MRKLNRSKVAAPLTLTISGNEGEIETNAAIAFFSKKTRPKGKKFIYKAYAHPSVKTALAAISNNKCAYCEASILATQDGDVEHFRPKGEVRDKGQQAISPGYYWLGAKWENLHLSCIHCNQARQQPTASGVRTLGKKNQFPLREPKKRIRTHKRNIMEEEPYRLLLDPCIDTPENHLFFDEEGMIFAKKTRKGISLEGETSIEVFGLARGNLVKARKDHATRTKIALSFLDDLIKDYKTAVKKKRSKITLNEKKRKLDTQINRLKALTIPDAEYSLFTFHLIKNYLSKFGIPYQL